ncbi:hypothetical protein F3Y22_tig00110239pilonHSYRG00196 [Hibiscus syriacus]|uniref:Uncharacterized protein n=1 Tax=Hibiscus syriacus TaxID=106335 RepID=A0A6A3B9H9_HIBSY|nr:hypothetical protein F3Y22_tig00110239pilonHSYRG00196 [Hibiscus syriacus]
MVTHPIAATWTAGVVFLESSKRVASWLLLEWTIWNHRRQLFIVDLRRRRRWLRRLDDNLGLGNPRVSFARTICGPLDLSDPTAEIIGG